MRLPASLTLALLVAPEPVSAQAWTGSFVRHSGEPALTLTLKQDQSGRVSGELTGAGQVFRLEGLPQAQGVAGRVTAAGGSGWFEAAFAGEELQLILYDSGPDGNPNLASAQQFAFARAAGPGAVPARPTEPVRAAPETSSVDDGTRLGREWRTHLAGKKATRMSRYSSGLEGGTTSRTDVHLCGNGQFGIRSQGSVSVDVGGAFGGAGGGSESAGRWRILTQGELAGIELKYHSGTVERYRLEFREGATYVEGERLADHAVGVVRGVRVGTVGNSRDSSPTPGPSWMPRRWPRRPPSDRRKGGRTERCHRVRPVHPVHLSTCPPVHLSFCPPCPPCPPR